MLGYRGNSAWRDMSEYVVHFTKPSETRSAYDTMIKILYECRLTAGGRFGAARNLGMLGETQKAVCFSEIPLDLLGRLVERRGTKYGIGFRQDLVSSAGGARVWYVDKDTDVAKAIDSLTGRAIVAADTQDPVWALTPFIDRPGEYGGSEYRFEWEREWRVPGQLAFTPEQVAFLFMPADLHGAARFYFAQARQENTGPSYDCPFIDPGWDATLIQAALSGLAS